MHNFWRKIFILECFINWTIFIVWLLLLCEILGNMCFRNSLSTRLWCHKIWNNLSNHSIFPTWPKSWDTDLNTLRKKRARQFFLEGESLTLSLFYRYYFDRCSSEVAQLVPLPFSWRRSTRYSDRLPDFSVTISRCCKDVYVNTFSPRTPSLWNSLPIQCFPLT